MNIEKDLFDDEKQVLQPQKEEIDVKLDMQSKSKLFDKSKLQNHDGHYFTQFLKGYFQLEKLTQENAINIIKKGAKDCGYSQLSLSEIDELVNNLELEFDDSSQPKKENQKQKSQTEKVKEEKQVKFANEFEVQEPFSTKGMNRKKIRYQLIVLSLICFAAYFLVTWMTPRFRYFGIGLRFSRGGALAIIVNTVICLFCMSREFITFLYSKKPTGIWRIYLDDNTYVHKVCGSLITFYGLVHTIGHLSSSYVAISQSTDLSELNTHAMFGSFSHIYTYWELLFQSLPGTTGVALMVLMIIMQLTAWGIVKEKIFEAFSYVHLVYVAYIVLLVSHGCNFWLNFGFPQSAPFIFIPVVLILKQIIKRIYAKRCGRNAQILSAEIIEGDQKIGLLKLRMPEYMQIFPGSFTYLNCPEISCNQWHPFSICNLGANQTIELMIKDYGDFTKELLRRIHLSNLHIQSLKEQQGNGYFFEYYPKVLLHDIIASPFALATESNHAIIIGAGVGISVCLQFLSIYSKKDLHIWCVSREIQLIKEVMKYNHDGIDVQSYYTRKISGIAEEVFWRAVKLGEQKLAKVKFGRPKFGEMIAQVNQEMNGAVIDVFVCGPKKMMKEVEMACRNANECGKNQYRMVREKFFK